MCVYECIALSAHENEANPLLHAHGALLIGGKKGHLPSCPHRLERDKGYLGTLA